MLHILSFLDDFDRDGVTSIGGIQVVFIIIKEIRKIRSEVVSSAVVSPSGRSDIAVSSICYK